MESTQRALETMRQRFARLVDALTKFQNELNTTAPDAIPPWPKLQSHFNLFAANLDSLATNLQTYFPSSATTQLASYPTPSFPPAFRETAIPMLLNKMLPDELKTAPDAPPPPAQAAEEEELWTAAVEIVQDHQSERAWETDLLTNEEMEAGASVEELLGVRRVSEAGDAARAKGHSLESMLRFCVTGVPVERQPPLPQVTIAGAGLKRS